VSANKQRKPGEPVYRKPESGLRLVKSPDTRPRPAPDPELQAVLDDMKRRYRVQRERAARDDGGKDAA
jgi:hypothetical protein